MKSATGTLSKSWALVFSDFKELTKVRLAFSVVFSSIAGYFLGAYQLDVLSIFLLAFGGYCMVGASNAYNQIIERDLDALMKRTRNRPLPAGRVSVNYALTTAIVMTILGVAALYMLNPKTALFGALSIFLYTSVYTPLKTITPLSVFVGAIPGAIPFMLGWVAATNEFGIEPGTLFMIQFFWQFPHFWAIGWLGYDEYKKAGFNMLPTGEKNKKATTQILLYTVWMIIVSIFPAFGVTGQLHLSPLAAVLVLLLGGYMLYFGILLHRKQTDILARKLMLASVLYITVLQIIYVIDKFI